MIRASLLHSAKGRESQILCCEGVIMKELKLVLAFLSVTGLIANSAQASTLPYNYNPFFGICWFGKEGPYETVIADGRSCISITAD